MSMAHDVLMPQLGQAMVRGRIVEWQAATGDHVIAGTHLLTIESDKFTYEIEAPATGSLQRLVEVGQEADIGMVLGRIGDGAAADSRLIDALLATAVADQAHAVAVPWSQHAPRPAGPLASPKAKAVAAGRIDLSDVPVSRADNLIVAADVERVLAARSATAVPRGGAIERLQQSWQQAPHFVQMVDVDATALVEAQRLRKAGRFSATLNDILVHAAAQTLEEFPAVNARMADGQPVRNDRIDISLAVATDRGLRTPTLRDVGGKPLAWVSERSREAIEAAKSGRANSGRASLTISNLGAHGIRQGTPVLNLDEAVLIFAGAITERAVVANGAVIARPQMTLSIAYDHRIVDGMQAAQFSAALRTRLERFDLITRRDGADAHPERAVTLRSDGKLRCDLTVGPHGWVIDEPLSIGGDGSAPDPVLHFLGALLSCMTIAFKVVAARRNVPLCRIAGDVSASPATGKVRQIAIQLTIWSPAEKARVEALLKSAKASCYVHDLLRDDLDLAVDLTVLPSGEAI
jgi:pyruvate/2-oxoglutarate dehydrogenase complex dihydrolipoamide acyltransferase (E2) component/uncharacterized OsmC-like protein